MKEQIKKDLTALVNKSSYIPQKVPELMRLLGVAGKENERAFYAALSELERDGIISFSSKGKVTLPRFGGRITGTFHGTSRGFGFVTPDENGAGLYDDILIPGRKKNTAIDGDRVAVRITSRRKSKGKNSVEGEITGIIERGRASIMCTVGKTVHTVARGRRRGGTEYLFAYPDSPKLTFVVRIDLCDGMGAKEGDKVEVALTRYPGENEKAWGRVICVFGNADSKEANYEAILRSNDVRTVFPDEAIAEAKECEKEKPICVGRRDLRGKMIFTIDGADAKDLDDAISLEVREDSYLLGVHIADVSHYVKEGSALDREAFLRGTSIYFTDKVVPMLPKELSNGICSLGEGEDRYALSCFVTLDMSGKIAGCELVESVINSAVRGVYSEINDVLDKRKRSDFYAKYAHIEKTLDEMMTLYEILAGRSKKRGALELESAEAKIILDETGHPTDIVRRERGESEKMIEQFMLCANEAVASFLFERTMPCVYRIHEDPDPEKIRAFAVFAHGLGIDTSFLGYGRIHPSSLQKIIDDADKKGLSSVVSAVLLRSLSKAKYSSENRPHFGLATDLYCHFTSPIRRYPDLAVHRIVKSVLKDKAHGEERERLAAFAENAAKMSSENELRALYAERDIEDLYKVVYMADRLGQEFDAVISSVNSFGMFAELDNTCEGLIPIESLDGYFDFDEKNYRLSRGKFSYRLGQRVRVVIESADIARRKVDMRLVR